MGGLGWWPLMGGLWCGASEGSLWLGEEGGGSNESPLVGGFGGGSGGRLWWEASKGRSLVGASDGWKPLVEGLWCWF